MTAVATLVIGLAGCTSQTPGEATPGEDDGTGLQIPTEGGGGETTGPPETSETDTESPTALLDVCELLSSDDQAVLSVGPGEVETLGDAETCIWRASNYTVSVDIWDDLSIDEVQSKTEPQPKTVGSRRAMQYTGELEVCVVAMELTDSSRVDVSGVARGDLDRACQIANQAAELVEPKLP